MVFDEKKYTEDALIKQLALTELHAKDGSALDAGCGCIESKHTFIIEGLAEEGKGFAMSEKEKAFYDKVADVERKIRKAIEDGSYEFPHNPLGRAYEPHGWTPCEKQHPNIQRKLRSCIKKVEKKEGCKPPYDDCPVNPVAVCRASIKCP